MRSNHPLASRTSFAFGYADPSLLLGRLPIHLLAQRLTVGVEEAATFGPDHKGRGAPHAAEGPHRRIDAARNDSVGALEKVLGLAHGEVCSAANWALIWAARNDGTAAVRLHDAGGESMA